MQVNITLKKKRIEIVLKSTDFSGTILADERTIESYKFDEKKFVVCMVNKNVKKEEASSSETKSASTESASKKDEPSPSQSKKSTE